MKVEKGLLKINQQIAPIVIFEISLKKVNTKHYFKQY